MSDKKERGQDRLPAALTSTLSLRTFPLLLAIRLEQVLCLNINFIVIQSVSKWLSSCSVFKRDLIDGAFQIDNPECQRRYWRGQTRAPIGLQISRIDRSSQKRTKRRL